MQKSKGIKVPDFLLLIADVTLQKCFFGIHLSKTETALNEFVQCGDSEMKNFSDIDKELQQMIIERCCVKEVDEDVMICSNHEEFLGTRFKKNVHADRNCLWPSHSDKRNAGTLKPPYPSFLGDEIKQSLFLFSNHNIVLPFQSKVCHKCKKECAQMLKDFDESFVRTPKIRRSNLVVDAEFAELGAPSPSNSRASQLSFQACSQTSSQSSYALPSQERNKNQKIHLDALMKECKIDAKVKSCLEEDWDNVSSERQRQILDYAGAGVASVLETIAPEQSGLLYRKLQDSNYYVEKHLQSEVPLSKFSEEIINTANGNSASYDALIQYFSTLVGIPGIDFEFLNQFNVPSNQENISSEDSDGNVIKVNTRSKFIFRFTRHMWISSVKRRRRFGYGNVPVIKEKKCNWTQNLETCEAIFNYIVSPLNTQRNSYGAINIKDDSGNISTIGKVIRHHRNSDLVRNIQSHLQGLGLPVPSRSFLFKFLAHLPAGSMKEMKGVNNIQEDAMRSFTTLENIVDEYSTKYGLFETERINLKACISASKTYIKTKYFNHLSMTNIVQSHCISCAVSDANDRKVFIAECGYDHENIECDRCQLIYQTIDVLKALMERYKAEQILSDYDGAVIDKRLNDSKAAILQYQAHLVKVFTQETEWEQLIETCDPTVAFYVADWGMKYLPRRHRCKMSEWFGQNGMPNHIGCFIRIVPNSFQEDGITTKDYEKQVDTYVSIVKDNAKQDALTSVAIIKENLIAYKKNYPEVKKVYLRSDNAGCYHSSTMIQALLSLKIPDFEIVDYIYSAPCDGKSICDTYFAIIKVVLNKGNSTNTFDSSIAHY